MQGVGHRANWYPVHVRDCTPWQTGVSKVCVRRKTHICSWVRLAACRHKKAKRHKASHKSRKK